MTSRARRRRDRCLAPLLVCACALAIVAAGARDARAQQPPAGGTGLLPKDNFAGIKHQFSFAISGGFDLDVLGDLVMGALGTQNGTQIAIRQARPWPDVYVTIPKRVEATIGFAVFQKDELLLRLGRASYTSDPMTDAGNYATAQATGDVTLTMSQYRERAVELGWRHYLAMTRGFKQYANFTYGIRTVDPLSATLSPNDGSTTFGTFRLYDGSRLRTLSLEIGVAFDFGHAGLFAEVGGRWQQRLARQDDDLIPWGMQALNNTGTRFYMPLQFGVLFRL